ncbi:patatin-like phospholipase family protein [Belliella sp. DSM 111904]|uniref:Patatin-like phospholipase family protein n=1 Tax=Belliella filtrata TaxID=2923435 RepID=A0ABS9V2S1_9BACT|nr:patatin-like phospholipase family protein [Belliella filtrata]MCH7410720.1 patatin-like phospholipase family protein [Belliella filtrata]
MGKKTVSLVLSSGGARGMAHIGVIEALEEAGYEIVSISGSSAGALVGGIYATGFLPVFKDWICNLDRIDVFSLMDFTLSTKGFIKGEKVFLALKKLIEDCKIEELKIPFNCTAVEIPQGKEKIFDKGMLFDAIRASVSIPTVLTPARIKDREYVDGGILNPLPLSLLPKKKRGEIIIAIDLNGPKEAFVEVVVAPSPKKETDSLIKVPRWVKDYKDKFAKYFESDAKVEKYKGMSSLELLNYSFDILQDKLTSVILERHKVDVLVSIARTQAGTLEFHRAAELAEIGKKKMQDALNEFENGNQ